MVVERRSITSPEDYIRKACELHLQAHVTDAKGLIAMEQFLCFTTNCSSNKVSKNLDVDTSLLKSLSLPSSSGLFMPVPRLFVWIPRCIPDMNGELEWAYATASTESVDIHNLGAIVFVRNNMSQGIQCMTLCSSAYGGNSREVIDDMKTVDPILEARTQYCSNQPGKYVLMNLQLYTRHCFVPAVRAMETLEYKPNNMSIETSATKNSDIMTHISGNNSNSFVEALEEKLRDLDMAFGQYHRSHNYRINYVTLHPHVIIRSTLPLLPRGGNGKLDFDSSLLSSLLADDSLLNEIQTTVTTWIEQIRAVTTLATTTPFPTHDSTSDTGADVEEILLWSSLEDSLRHIRAELAKPSSVLTLSILRSAKRFVAIMALEHDTHLGSAETIVTDVNTFLQNYPARALASARDWKAMNSAIDALFDHVPRVIRSRYYDVERLCRLVESSTWTLRRQIECLLRDLYGGTGLILALHYETYLEEVDSPSRDLFLRFDNRYSEFVEFILEHGRRWAVSGTSRITPKQMVEQIVLYHQELRDRLEAVTCFRTQHKRLRQVVIEVLASGEIIRTVEVTTPSITRIAEKWSTRSAIQEVENSPTAFFTGVNVLDTSACGKNAFNAALDGYNRKINRIEERLASLLREKLTACQDAETMFQVFSRFNPLLSRTRVHIAVKEFQQRLIKSVNKAIERLQLKFTHKYESSSTYRISLLRGIPPVTGKILWAKQVERQVLGLMKRMSDVLGPQWENHLDSRQLRSSCDDLLTKLDAKGFFRSWMSECERTVTLDMSSRTRVQLHNYPILIVRKENVHGYKSLLVPQVNFDHSHEFIFHEVRYLSHLGFERDIPRSICRVAEEALARYPYAILIRAALRSYAMARKMVSTELEQLLRPELISTRDAIAEAFDISFDHLGNSRSKLSSTRRIRWNQLEMSTWVMGLNELVARFEERVETLLQACQEIEFALVKMETISYDHHELRHIIRKAQDIVDGLSLAGYCNLGVWVKGVNVRISIVLQKRLDAALVVWSNGLHWNKDKKNNMHDISLLSLSTLTVEILLCNQQILTQPAIPTVRAMVMSWFHEYVEVVCSLPRLTSGRFEVFDSADQDSELGTPETFNHLIKEVNPEKLARAYEAIQCHICAISEFVGRWISYQVLWDTHVSDVISDVGENLAMWNSLLIEVTDSRTTLDTTTIMKDFGPIVVRYDKLQAQINLKFDLWQHELQTCYAGVLGNSIFDLHEKVCGVKIHLEKIYLENNTISTHEIMSGVTLLQETKSNLRNWGNEIKRLQDAERVLKQQRYVFRLDWLESSILEGQYQNMEQILIKRDQTMGEQMPLLQSRILSEHKVSALRTSELLAEWEAKKPLRGNMKPKEAINILASFEVKIRKAKLDEENLLKVKDTLQLEIITWRDSVVSESLDELSDLKSVWEALNHPYIILDQIKDISWITVTSWKIKKQLDNIILDMKTLPNKVRQYDAYTYLNDTIKSYIGGYDIINNLKTKVLKDRHWKKILLTLGIIIPYNELTLGMLWDHRLVDHRKEVTEILSVAQGEMALENFLTQIQERWMTQEIELVQYRDRVPLIRGWNNIFPELDDHMGGLTLMKSSPYYREVQEFQEEGKLWEERLTKLRSAFDSWVDTQRKWVHLEGIFFGNSDIKILLPAEWSRFKNVDVEFVSLMRRMSNRPYALEALSIDNLPETLERLGNLMGIIQRALGDYLAKQRSNFSRFYFLGDDDLLEIIGNNGEPRKALIHLGKIFPGLSNAISNTITNVPDTLAIFDGMVSKDGEIVNLHQPIIVSSKTPTTEWLQSLEDGMHTTLENLLVDAIEDDFSSSVIKYYMKGKEGIYQWASFYPAQIMILTTLINWSMDVDKALCANDDSKDLLSEVLNSINDKLEVVALIVLLDLRTEVRKKVEHLITELVHQRDVTRSLISNQVSDPNDFRWLSHLRFQYNPTAERLNEKLCISLSNANFFYGFEYLGIGDRLVQTPLTDRCYLTLTQALKFRMGGNPFGPAGTGKTESVKSLGRQLGRFVVVMNCDETFDFGAMGRIFCGLCQLGAWGCFDEFNRLEECVLSAVSQHILSIQRGLMQRQKSIELLGKSIRLSKNVGIFVTMNPGYAGRSNLPDNLKSLFRSVAMVVPDHKLITEVVLYSQGIANAHQLAEKIVYFFQQCELQMSSQSHYDFGLRALKSLLVSVGDLKRKTLERTKNLQSKQLAFAEEHILIQCAFNNILPKLVADDLDIFSKLLLDIFPDAEVSMMEDDNLKKEIIYVCKNYNLVPGKSWLQKVLQVEQVLNMRHGIMLVGCTGVGKSSSLKVLIKALENISGIKGEKHIIDAKVLSKEGLYGALDTTTMDWTDGVFTHLLRRILVNQKGEADKRHWIIFDGEIDPEWAENLNSVLDDNKMLTLPSGERLGIPNNIRIIFEVDNLLQTTPATVSRCGMVWFREDTVSLNMCLHHLFYSLRVENILECGGVYEIPTVQTEFMDIIKSNIISDFDCMQSLVAHALKFSIGEVHIMAPTRERLIKTLRAMLIKGIKQAIDYDANHPGFRISGDHMINYAKKWLLYSLLWSFSGSCSWSVRKEFGHMLLSTSGFILPSGDQSNLAEYRVRVEDGEYELWSVSVPRKEIESHKVRSTDVVVITNDILRHCDVLKSILSSKMPIILCGPPGSGKTMTMTRVLQSIQGIVMTSLNFSSCSTPDIILKTFTRYCNYVRKGKDIVLEPSHSFGTETWLIIFCDEINLPENDRYGTQRVLMFMRQLIEHGGYWRNDNTWIIINRIQFVGACNPTDHAGRIEMSCRFLRHLPLLLVDFPSRDSLIQIYGTFNTAMMKLFPNLRTESQCLTEAMIEIYLETQRKFTPEIQPQYFFSPRELSRWTRGIYEIIVDHNQGLTREELVRIFTHEAFRLFCDRLVKASEKKWCENKIEDVVRKFFTGVNHNKALARPLFYSNWLTKDICNVNRDELKEFLDARLKVFYEEKLDVPLVIFDDVMDHILRIDRVLRQPMGHCLLVGDSGVGKTVLTKFVSWMNGLNIFEINTHLSYDIEDLHKDLRSVMRRVGVEGEKVCFIFDESNVLGSGFLEAMNALLASGEIPGLFEGDEYRCLVSACRDRASRDRVIAENDDELWRRFTISIQRNLHVVFSMNPSGDEWKKRSTTSPALFNRCVVDWFGTWSNKGMAEIGKQFTMMLDIGNVEYNEGNYSNEGGEHILGRVSDAFGGSISASFHQAVIAALVDFHNITTLIMDNNFRSTHNTCRTYLSPRDYLTLIRNFVTCVNRLREEIEDQQLHVNAGLLKLSQTQENVVELRIALTSKSSELNEKESLGNKKLQQMVINQKEAEKKKKEAEKMSFEVEKQQKKIFDRKEEAQKELDDAEPALLNAKAAVKSIKKRDLDEVRNLLRPPINVQLTLECVALILGEKKLEWVDVRKMLGKSDFILSILKFDVDKLTIKQVKMVEERYLSGKKELSYDVVMRSSKACGPLYKWAESQVRYFIVYNRVLPLREEVAKLEKDADVAKKQKGDLEAKVMELEDSISQYKAEYAQLICDTEALKTEMKAVTTKVNRAESLLKSLNQESERWSKSSQGFQNILKSHVGDGLLMAGFLTYLGFFDYRVRMTLMQKWRDSLNALGIEYNNNLNIVENLSKASERLQWQSQGLPSDTLSFENGVIIQHCDRFPLLIDPSGHAINFIVNKLKKGKLQKVSFLDNSFIKTLISAIRFGTTLIVENVESINPILNPILNKEMQRTGGRLLIRIGAEEVDYSPKFNIILTTKNPAVKLTPDLCSRVTLINFTVTPDSLQSQSMSLILQAINPEVEEKRIDILKFQSHHLVKLRDLEKKILNKLSAVEGSVLDDDLIVDGMEYLMKEGVHVEEQISNNAHIMKQVQNFTGKFESFTVVCRNIFVLMQSLRKIHFLYEFSEKSFMKILASVLSSKNFSNKNDEEIQTYLKENMHKEVLARVGRVLIAEDKMVFALILSKFYGNVKELPRINISVEEIAAFISDAFGPSLDWHGRGLNQLKHVTLDEIDAFTPLMLCSAPGHDTSGRIESMASREKKVLYSVAMGSSEGFNTAEHLISIGSKRGEWVMLTNCHLCCSWLEDYLSKRVQLFGSRTHPDFRLFITSDINLEIPTSLLRLCDIILTDASTGIKSSLTRFFISLPDERLKNSSRNRLYLILGWTYAVMLERLCYIPEGWRESYNFSESDALHALDVIDSLVEDTSGVKVINDPEKFPWDAIRSTLSQGVFGGRITIKSDKKTLDELIDFVFNPGCFDINFKLVDCVNAPTLPDVTSKDNCFSWITSLPIHTPPSWIRLSESVESARSKRTAQSVFSKTKIIEDSINSYNDNYTI